MTKKTGSYIEVRPRANQPNICSLCAMIWDLSFLLLYEGIAETDPLVVQMSIDDEDHALLSGPPARLPFFPKGKRAEGFKKVIQLCDAW